MGNVIVLFGKPGAGKGTRVSKFLEGKEEQFDVLSVSNMLKQAVKEQTEQGKIAEEYMNSGKLVPNEIVNSIVISTIQAAQKDVFIDGFPRTEVQAQAMLEAGIKPDLVVEFFVDDEIVVQRAKDRLACSKCGETYTTNAFKRPKQEGVCDKCGHELIKRKDDQPEIVKERLEVYRTQTYPVLEIFKNNDIEICTIDNSQGDSYQEFVRIMNELV